MKKIVPATPIVSAPCTHPEHAPPSMIVLGDGTYEHECPRCKRKSVFTISKPSLLAARKLKAGGTTRYTFV